MIFESIDTRVLLPGSPNLFLKRRILSISRHIGTNLERMLSISRRRYFVDKCLAKKRTGVPGWTLCIIHNPAAAAGHVMTFNSLLNKWSATVMDGIDTQKIGYIDTMGIDT